MCWPPATSGKERKFQYPIGNLWKAKPEQPAKGTKMYHFEVFLDNFKANRTKPDTFKGCFTVSSWLTGGKMIFSK